MGPPETRAKGRHRGVTRTLARVLLSDLLRPAMAPTRTWTAAAAEVERTRPVCPRPAPRRPVSVRAVVGAEARPHGDQKLNRQQRQLARQGALPAARSCTRAPFRIRGSE